MIVFCIVDTEEETGGDRAGEVSTGVESESVVRRRRVAVTRRLVPLAGGPSIVFLRPTQAKLGVDSYWRRHLWGYVLFYMSIFLVLLLVCSMFVTHFSCFRSVLRRSFVFLHSGYGTSASVSLSLCR